MDWDAVLREHEAALTVGTRVRIMPGEGCHHHGTQEAGVTGVVISTEETEPHNFLVLFDRPLPIIRTYLTVWTYSAVELTPITHEEVLADIMKRAGLDTTT